MTSADTGSETAAPDLPGVALGDAFWRRDAVQVGSDLLGKILVVDGAGGRIVETEAYRPDDPASHSFRGLRTANAAMFGEPGTAYVYRSYGIHWCLNAVCLPGSAVLLRALEPLWGLQRMQERRGGPGNLCGGPGRLCMALGVTIAHNGLRLDRAPFAIVDDGTVVDRVTGPRIGITKATELPWRFGVRGSAHLSRRFAP